MVGLGFCRVFLFGGPRNSFGISACLIDKIKSTLDYGHGTKRHGTVRKVMVTRQERNFHCTVNLKIINPNEVLD